jgi:hypothetical protein
MQTSIKKCWQEFAIFLNLFKINMYSKKKCFQSNDYGHMDVNQNKFGGLIIITALVHGI